MAIRKSSCKYWRFVLEFIYQSLCDVKHTQYKRFARTSRASELQYKFKLTMRTYTLNKMRCKFTLYAKYLKKMRYGKSVSFLLNIFLAWQFLMSSRQCSSHKLMTLQIWPFFSSYHAQFLETHYSYLIELFTDMPQAMLNKQVTMARNYFKSFCSCKIVRSSSDGFVIRS